jgi:hypothetical protein
MKEKLRFLEISKVKFSEIEESQELQAKVSQLSKQEFQEKQIEMPLYDITLEHSVSYTKLELLDTKVKEVTPKPIIIPHFDINIIQPIKIQPIQMPITNLIQPQIPEVAFEIFDFKLLTANVDQLSTSLSTELKSAQMPIVEESIVPVFDVNLISSDEILIQTPELNTQLITILSGVESLEHSQEQLFIFEKLICLDEDNSTDRKFPRSFGESLNSPFIVLIGENEKEWHLPITYALKELFHEITERYPRITFRESELELDIEGIVDSLDLHSLEQFAFEHKIEFLDARKRLRSVRNFVRMVRGRLKSGFLQQFGILIVAVKPNDLEKAINALKIGGLRVYICKPKDEDYEMFCAKIFGLNSPHEFFNGLKEYEKDLERTVRNFSIFVKRYAKRDRETEATEKYDKYQYPLKVATFVYLLNDLIDRRKKIINSFEELYQFAKDVLDKEEIIKIETPILNGKVIPDLIYNPEGKEIYIEIETLIGTLEPLKKIDETIEKYKELRGCQIWVVLRPVSALLHYEELKAREKAYKLIYGDKEIKFKVLTLQVSNKRFRWDLVDLDEFISRDERKYAKYIKGKDVK